MNGIYIKKLMLKGIDKESALVEFKKGANLVSGPSNTGKTFIFECIEYMLGSSSIERRIKESRGYQELLMELSSFNQIKFTLKSDFEGGDFYMYECPISEISNTTEYKVLKRKHTPNKTNTLSYVLLKKCGLAGSRVRTNARGKTRELSFRDIRILHLVDEIKIISKGSPFLTGQYQTPTVEENVMKLLLSGSDDSNIIESISDKILSNKAGRMEMLTELIGAAKSSLSNNSEEDLLVQVKQLEESINEHKNKRTYIFNKYQKTSDFKETKLSERRKLIVRHNELSHLYENSIILEKQYHSDIQRLRSTIEASSSINSIEKNTCPLCKTEYKDDNFKSISIINESATSELLKIEGLLNELLKAKLLFKEETKTLGKNIISFNDEINELIIKLDQGLKSELNEILLILDKMQKEKNENTICLNEYKKLASLEIQKNEIQDIIANAPPKKRIFDTVTASLLEDILNEIQILLTNWGYPKIENVSYDEKQKDLIISNENRNLTGKGYRALTYSSFVLSLNKYEKNRNGRLGFCVIDSPLVTYKKPDVAEGEGISEDMASQFYRSLCDTDNQSQVIIIENEEIPSDVENKLHHVHFTKNTNFGRYGFIPL